MRKTLTVLSIGIVLLAAGCRRGEPQEVRITNIARIFMHERGHYTFLVRQADGVTLVPVTADCSPNEQFVADVPEGDLSWVTWMEYRNGHCVHGAPFTIHLHHASQVLGAGWNHGKFGSGMMQVVE